MNSIQTAYINALLADASYVSVTNGINSSDMRTRLTPIQSDYLATHFELIDFESSPSGGFDAVVWRGRENTQYAGQVYVSMRGTQGGQDISDDISLALRGVPHYQIAAMVNWWLRATSSTANVSVPQIKVQEARIFPLATSYNFLSDTPASGTGELFEKVNFISSVNGHSLGGYLSTAFARLFGAKVGSVSTFNSAGFSSIASFHTEAAFTQVEQLIGNSASGLGSFRAVEPLQTNFYSENGLSVTTNSWADFHFLAPGFKQYGGRIALNQEDFLGGDPIANHAMYKLTDLLSMGAALSRLDQELSIEKLNVLLRASANDTKASYERLLDAMRLMLDPTTKRLQVSDAGDSDPARVSFHQMLDSWQKSGAFAALEGKVTLSSAAGNRQLQTQAKGDFGAFLALHVLSPVVITTYNEVATAVLKAAHGEIAVAWQADKNARLYGDTAYMPSYSDAWYEDRTALLNAVIIRNQTDNEGVLTATNAGAAYAKGVLYEDVTSATTIRTGTVTDLERPRVWFGDATAESKSGTALADHLFGGAGYDALSGLNGNDHLEGNEGNDFLLGGDGADTLLGGTGNDVLEGGFGDDILTGGADSDTYTFNATWGHDIVDDSDGSGTIVVTGLGQIKGEGAMKVAQDAWQTADKKVNYTLVTVDASRRDLYITFSDRPDVITLRNWSETKSLGITLAPTPAPAPIPAATYVGDFSKLLTGTTYAYVAGNYVTNGTQTNAADVITGSASADKMSGLGGNDALAGMQGNDQIDGGGGSDALLGGAGSDTLLGGDGGDFIFGAGAGGLTYPLSTLTPAQVAGGPEIARGFDWVAYDAGTDGNGIPMVQIKGIDGSWVADDTGNLIDGGAGNDWIDGGPGRDTIHGGADNDAIDGLGQADILFGDGGNDTIGGDGIALAGYWSTVPADQHGDDIIDGGSGNDDLTGQGGADQIYGGIGNDSLWGDDTDPRFTPHARHGADFLHGGDGDDQLTGGGSNDTLSGGEGNDLLIADMSLSQLPGEYHGSDLLEGGNGADYLEGGGKDDRLFGGAADDMLWGDSASAELAAAYNGADYIDGGEGNDVLVGGGRADTLYGAGGDDVMTGDGSNTVASDEGDDLLDGGAGNDILQGGGGADLLDGAAGNDFLQGEDGNDTLVGGAGTDVLQGGAGDDTYLFRPGDSPLDAVGKSELVDDARGVNVVRFQGASPEAMTITALSNGTLQFRTPDGGSLLVIAAAAGSVARYEFDGVANFRSDQLIGSYSTSAVIATGADGKQRAIGGKNNDDLTVSTNAAVLSGGRGSDSLRGSGGNNTYLYEAGDGADTFTDTSAKTSTSGTPMPNRIVFGGGITPADLTLTNSGGAGGFRIVIGNDPSQGVRLGGFNASDAAAARPIDNLVFADGTSLSYAQLIALGFDGTPGDDLIHGTALDDRMDGGLGNDTLYGGVGSDTLDTGLGMAGVVDGGEGNDTFIFGRGYGAVTRNAAPPGQAASSDAIRLHAGVTSTDLIFSRNDTSLVIKIASSNDSFTATGHFVPGGGQAIAQLSFADGSVLTRSAFEALLSTAGTPGNDNLNGGLGVDVIDGGEGNDFIYGEDGDDRLYGGRGADTLYGAGGNDYLDGGDQAGYPEFDVLDAGAGDDTLVDGNASAGGPGRDTYVMSQWGVTTTITEWPSIGPAERDVLLIPAGVTPADIKLGRSYNASFQGYDDLTLTALVPGGSSPVTLTIERYFLTQDDNYKVEEFRFANNTVWQHADILARIPSNQPTSQKDELLGFRWADTIRGLGGDDTISGYEANDLLYGDAGNDRLSGDAGNDTLDGGAGRDLLTDSSGNDTYVFGRGYGFDRIDDNTGTDRLTFTAGIVQADVTLFRLGNDLRLMLDQGTTQLELLGQFGGGSKVIERMEFADGSFWDTAAILSRAVTGTANSMTGTAANDVFVVDNTGDSITEAANQGIDTVQSSISYTLGIDVENLTLTGKLNIDATGNSLDNVLIGNAGNNIFNGTDLVWWIARPWSAPYTLAGADTMVGGAGDDLYWVNGPSADSLDVDDAVIEEAGGGNDTVYLFGYDYTLPANVESLIASSLNYALYTSNPYGPSIPILRKLTGNSDGNVIDARASYASSYIDGGAGADTLYGRGGDTFVVDHPDDVIVASTSPYSTETVRSSIDHVLQATLDNLILTGSAAINGVGNALSNTLDGSVNSAANVLTGGAGDDIYRLGPGDTPIEVANEGNDTVEVTGPTGLYLLADYPNIETLTLGSSTGASTAVGTVRADSLVGNNANNVLEGGGGDDTLTDAPRPSSPARADDQDELRGGAGNDTLNSISGFDVLDGGVGNDTLYLEARGNSGMQLFGSEIRFGRGDGQDLLFTSNMAARITLKDGIEANQLRFSRDGAHLVIGLDGSNDRLTVDSQFLSPTSSEIRPLLHQLVLPGGDELSLAEMLLRLRSGNTNAVTAGSDFLIGAAGADSLSAGDGEDTVWGGVGNDILSGGDGGDVLKGGSGDDALYGNAGADLLFGGAGNDDLSAGSGDDTIVADEGTDIIRFNPGDGVDLLLSADQNDTVVFGAGISVGEVTFSKAGGGTLFSPEPRDLLITLPGGLDRLQVRGFLDALSSISVRFADGTTLTSAALRELISGINGTTGSDTLNGTSGDDRIFGLGGNDMLYGQGGNDRLDGGPGVDLMQGGTGDDAYWVDNTGDQVLEAATAGIDTVYASVAYTLASNVENLTLTGSAGIAGKGNGLANLITGNAGNNVLDGMGGADRMKGGSGDDIYIVDSAADLVEELAGEGVDTVEATVTYSLASASHVENLTLAGTAAINGTGNSLNNVLTGNGSNNALSGGAGNDTLNGGAGSDTMLGGPGDDAYIVEAGTDVVTELASEGVDSVSSSVTYTLGANMERLTLTGSAAINGNGNALANDLNGNAGNNILDGLGGADRMSGGAGNDTYRVDNAADAVVELAGEGSDSVISSVTYTLAANVESLTLTGTSAINGTGNNLDNVLSGNSVNNVLSGGAGNDLLDGGIGNDTMVGGTGNDNYVVNVATDVVTELADQGIDTVTASVTLTLAAHVEHLTLSGTAAINGTGNTLNNTLTGNSANNRLAGGGGDDTLDGGAGSDTMVGNAGNDTYIVNLASDVITESPNEGTDTVVTAVGLTLGANIENLSLAGSAAINGIGNALDNVLRGNGAANVLTGQAGADVLDGAGGNDTLIGGTGGDNYVFGRGWGVDTVQENDATAGVKDRVFLQGSLTAADLSFIQMGNNLEMSINNSSDKLVFQNWYLGSQYRVEEIQLTNGSVLTNAQAQTLVGAIAAFGGGGMANNTPLTRRTTIPPLELAPNLLV